MAADDALAGAMAVTDRFLSSFNGRDPEAHARTLAYPHVRLASETVRIWQTFDEALAAMTLAIPALERAGWHHSEWDHRTPIHVGEDKVHLDVQFTRYRADGSVIGEYPAVYAVVRVPAGDWLIQARSSFAP